MSEFREKLKALMPKRPEPKPSDKLMIAFEMPIIRHHADSFAAHLQGLPANEEEFRAALWVFGEMLCGDMERRMNAALDLAAQKERLRMPEIMIPVKR